MTFQTGQKVQIFLGAVLLLCCLLIANTAETRMFVNTKLASGILTDIQNNNVIEIDGDAEFYPANPNIQLDLKTGIKVTVRYWVTPDGTKEYLEISPGLNSLAPRNAPSADSDKKH